MCCCSNSCAKATTTPQPDTEVETNDDGSTTTVHVGEVIQIRPNGRDGVTVSYGADEVRVFPAHDGGLVVAINSGAWAERNQRGPVGYLVVFDETTLYGNLRQVEVVKLATVALGTQAEPDGRAAVRGALATGMVV